MEIDILEEMDEITMTRRIVVSQIYGVYDPLELLFLIMTKYKLLLQILSTLSVGCENNVEVKLAKESRSILEEMTS